MINTEITINYMVVDLIKELEKFNKSIVSLWDGASEQEIVDTETHIGQVLPDEYKEFIRNIKWKT